MDGYALRHGSFLDDSARETVKFRIIGESPAGRPCAALVKKGDAVRIMTGGVVPEGADTVVKIEDTIEKDGLVICTTIPSPGDGIRSKGDSLRKGDLVLRAGDVITPLEVGALASLRRAYVYVYRKPIVAILSTGDELSDFHEPSMRSKAMCSNLYTLAAQTLNIGATPLLLGMVGDDIDDQQSILRESLRADVIITSGGTSRGKYDLIHKTFASLGMELRFSNIFAKPGKPTTFGSIQNSLIFGLPGNPSATMLSFEQFIKPALLKMMGYRFVPGSANGNNGVVGDQSPFSRIDSFNAKHGGNKDHKRASQVPLRRMPPDSGSHLQNNAMTPNTVLGHLKIVTK